MGTGTPNGGLEGSSTARGSPSHEEQVEEFEFLAKRRNLLVALVASRFGSGAAIAKTEVPATTAAAAATG